MKIKSLETNHVFILPSEGKRNIVVSGDFKGELLSCLDSYFASKRKTRAYITDSYDNVISMKDYNFIYLPYGKEIDGNFHFKAKSVFSSEITKVIEQNEESFTTLEMIRKILKEFESDKGMFGLSRILGDCLDKDIRIQYDKLDVSSILTMFEIESDELSESQKYMVVYNLLLYLNRSTSNIVFIDFPVSDEVLNWLERKEDSNIYYVNIEMLQADLSEKNENFPLIILSPYDFFEEINLSSKSAGVLSYLFHSYVSQNIQYQTERNKRIFELFYDKKSTYLVKFDMIPDAVLLEID